MQVLIRALVSSCTNEKTELETAESSLTFPLEMCTCAESHTFINPANAALRKLKILNKNMQENNDYVLTVSVWHSQIGSEAVTEDAMLAQQRVTVVALHAAHVLRAPPPGSSLLVLVFGHRLRRDRPVTWTILSPLLMKQEEPGSQRGQERAQT